MNADQIIQLFDRIDKYQSVRINPIRTLQNMLKCDVKLNTSDTIMLALTN